MTMMQQTAVNSERGHKAQGENGAGAGVSLADRSAGFAPEASRRERRLRRRRRLA